MSVIHGVGMVSAWCRHGVGQKIDLKKAYDYIVPSQSLNNNNYSQTQLSNTKLSKLL